MAKHHDHVSNNGMNEPGTFDWLYFAVMYSILGCYFFVQIRYLIRRHRRNSWPCADATIQQGAIGKISVGRGGTILASFIGYTYNVQGLRYAGYFAICGNEAATQELYESLSGEHIQIRYSPSDPNISLLVDYKDFRFKGLKATQSPQFLNQAPAFDLQDAIRSKSR